MQGDEFAGECDDSIAFFEQLRSDHHSHRHPKLHRTTLCVTGPRNQRSRALSGHAKCLSFSLDAMTVPRWIEIRRLSDASEELVQLDHFRIRR